MRRKRCKQQITAMPIVADSRGYFALYADISDQTFAELSKWFCDCVDRIGSNPHFDDLARDMAVSGVAIGFTRALEVVGKVSESNRGMTDAIVRHVIAAKRRARLPVQVGELANIAKVSRRSAQDWLHGRETGTVTENRLSAAYEREFKKLCQ